MHMWHHVTNHLIISNDKDFNSENRIKLRVRDIDDAHRTTADTRAVLESELEQGCTALEEEHKLTTELDGHVAFLKLEVESSSMRGSDTAIWLKERMRALEWELLDVAAEAVCMHTEAEAWVAERVCFEQKEKQIDLV
jgi:hypothetical protein